MFSWPSTYPFPGGFITSEELDEAKKDGPLKGEPLSRGTFSHNPFSPPTEITNAETTIGGLVRCLLERLHRFLS